MQRIPRYILLLNELKKHTWSDHRDYKAVVEAWTQVQEVANYVNQKKKESEDLSKVLEIESKIEGVLKRELVEAHRKFVTELEVKVLKDKKKADRTLLVFNDLILVTKHSGDKYKLVDEINLDPKWVRMLPRVCAVYVCVCVCSVSPDTMQTFRCISSPRCCSSSSIARAAPPAPSSPCCASPPSPAPSQS